MKGNTFWRKYTSNVANLPVIASSFAAWAIDALGTLTVTIYNNPNTTNIPHKKSAQQLVP